MKAVALGSIIASMLICLFMLSTGGRESVQTELGDNGFARWRSVEEAR